jgi:transcriptional regulator
MYVPEAFTVVDGDEIHAFIQRYDFATMVSSPTTGLIGTHVPVVVRRETTGLVVVGHLARANPHWRVMDGSVECLAMFHGPHSYVSPTWYVNSPAVPTWNYAVVHAYGKPRFREDGPFIESVLGELVHRYESHRAEPWRIEDQPADFRDQMLTRIVGFEMPVLNIQAKFKIGQNRRLEDRTGTIAGLEREKSSEGIALAEFMRAHQGG